MDYWIAKWKYRGHTIREKTWKNFVQHWEEVTGERFPGRSEKQNQALRLADLCLSLAKKLFYSPEDMTYVRVPVRDHFENLAIHSTSFRRWLGYEHYKATGKPVGNKAIEDALLLLDGKARFENSAPQEVYVRLARVGQTVYWDLANEKWEALEITPEGYKVISDLPVNFRRLPDMKSLPYPIPGGEP